MRKLIAVFIIGTIMALVSGCGGSSSSSSNVTTYELPAPLAAPFPAVLGGSLQGASLLLTNTVSTFSGSSAGFSNRSTVTSPTAKFNRPIAVTSDGANLYVADYYNNAIRKIVIATGLDTTIAGSPFGFAGSGDGTGVAATFNRPRAITTDGANLYIADSGNYTIRKIDLTTKQVSTLAGGAALPGSIDAIGTNARFNVMNGITTDGVNVYVTDSSNTIRRVLIATGSVSTLAGSPGTTGSVDGVQSAARFNQPAGVTTDGLSLYVTDLANRTIRRIILSSGAVSTIAGKVVAGSPGANRDSTDGTGLSAEFKQPNGIACDGFNLYVTDSYDNLIRKIVLSPGSTASGPVTTLAGIGTAALNSAIGITTDGAKLYITNFTIDTLGHTIQVIQ